jgi:7,8-dihydropterin-6-yl-methyl-4-(beta-D-ribofuranosyl)aminobenzene 5'-phosphate synthase
MNQLRITVLCENTVGRLVGIGEHGFSAFIETEAGNFLFDTGSGAGIVLNSLLLGKDLRSIGRLFLSHGHSDHTGGLPEVLKLRGRVPVHAHPGIFQDRLAILNDNGKETRRFAGLIYKRAYLETLGADFVFNTGFTEIEKGLFLTGEVPRKTDFEKPDTRLCTECEGVRTQDAIGDDQSLLLDTDRGLVVVLGCAHSGAINILRYALEKTGRETIHAVMGGTHLGFLTAEQLDESIRALKAMKVDRIGVSHCTGMAAAARLSQEFGDRFFHGCVGATFEI